MQQLSQQITLAPKHCIRPADALDRVVDASKEQEKLKKRMRQCVYRATHPDRIKAASNKFLASRTFQQRVATRIYQYKHKCGRKGLQWRLTDEAAWMMQSPCHYCLVPVSNNKPQGIDRIDNEPLYDLHCAVACCITCNRGKGIMSYDAFMAYIANMRKRLAERDLQK